MASHQDRRIAYSQNLLRDVNLVRKLVDQSSIGPDDVVLEIGPGRGILTRVLAERSAHVIAVELDERMAGPLARQLADVSNATLFTGDARAFPLPTTPYKVFANVPYRITAEIVAKLTSGVSPPSDAWLAVQREAAERFIGVPATTLVAVRLAPWFGTEIVHMFRRSDFQPRAAVDSVLLRLSLRGVPLIPHRSKARFDDFVVGIFSAWAPTVKQALEGKVSRTVIASLGGELQRQLAVRPSRCSPLVFIELFGELEQRGVSDAFAGSTERLERQQQGLQKDHRTRVARDSRTR